MNSSARARGPAGGSGHATLGGPTQAMGITATPTASRPRALGPRRQTSDVRVAVGRRGRRQGDRTRHRPECRRDHRRAAALAQAPAAVPVGPPARRSTAASHAPVPPGTARGAAPRAAGAGLRVHRLEHRAPGRVPGEADRHRRRPRPAAAAGACRGLRGRAAQAHAQGQARRAGVPQAPPTLGAAKKGAAEANASYELWYADATEFELLPHLVRCWMPRGRQREVRTPGKNRKVAAFGAWCYGRELFLHHTQPRVTAWGMRRLVQLLLARARRTGRRIVLVLDRGNPNHARALHRDLELAEPHVEAFWLPNYCWNLNLIERLWKHLKATRVANVLFASFRQFVRHVEAALADFAEHPDLSLSV